MMTLKKFLVSMVLGCIALYLASFVTNPADTIQASRAIMDAFLILMLAFAIGYVLHHGIQHYLEGGDDRIWEKKNK